MSDVYSNKLKVTEIEVGASNDTWGGKVNVNMDLIDERLSTIRTISLSNTTPVTLTNSDGVSDESRPQALLFTGTLLQNIAIVIPDTGSRMYVVVNDTSGAFTLTITTSGGATSVELPQDGRSYLIYRRTTAAGILPIRPVKGAMLNEAQTWTKAQGMTCVTLTDASTIAVDASLSNSFVVTLTADRTLGNPTGMVGDQIFDVLAIQDGTGTHTLSYGNKYRAPSGAFPVITATANRGSLLTFRYYSAIDRFLLVGATLNFNVS